MTKGNAGPEGRRPRGARRVALLVFLLGVVVPAVFAVDRWFGIAMENTFPVSDADPVEFRSDLVLQVTAVVIGASMATLIGLATYERTRGRRPIVTIVYALIALALMAMNLFAVFALRPT
jgi:hypothetical protein